MPVPIFSNAGLSIHGSLNKMSSSSSEYDIKMKKMGLPSPPPPTYFPHGTNDSKEGTEPFPSFYSSHERHLSASQSFRHEESVTSAFPQHVSLRPSADIFDKTVKNINATTPNRHHSQPSAINGKSDSINNDDSTDVIGDISIYERDQNAILGSVAATQQRRELQQQTAVLERGEADVGRVEIGRARTSKWSLLRFYGIIVGSILVVTGGAVVMILLSHS